MLWAGTMTDTSGCSGSACLVAIRTRCHIWVVYGADRSLLYGMGRRGEVPRGASDCPDSTPADRRCGGGWVLLSVLYDGWPCARRALIVAMLLVYAYACVRLTVRGVSPLCPPTLPGSPQPNGS